jgi:tetratricopeptide (TPR) repeat protein
MMTISPDPSKQRIEKFTLKGKFRRALRETEIILTSEELTKKERIDYLFLKIKALIGLGHYSVLEELFKLEWEYISKYGTEIQQIDFLLLKTDFVCLSMDFLEKNITIFKEIEKILENSIEKESLPFIQRRILFLAAKGAFMVELETNTDPNKKLVEEAIRLSKEINYEYGLIFSKGRYSLILQRDLKYAESIKVLKEVLGYCKKTGNKFCKLRALQSIGHSYRNEKKYKLSYKYLRKSNRISKKIGAKGLLAMSHKFIAEVKILHHSDHDEGIKHFEICHQISQEIGLKYYILLMYQNVGTVYGFKMEHYKSIPYYEKGFELSQEMGHDRMAYVFIRDLGFTYISLGELNKAIKNLEMALDHFTEKNYLWLIASTKSGLSRVYTIKGDLEKALAYVKSAAEYYEQVNDLFLLSEALRYTGEIHQKREKYNLALENIEKSIEVAKLVNYQNRLVESYFCLVFLFLETNDIENAQRLIDLLEKMSEDRKEILVESRTLLAKALLSKANEDIEIKLQSKNLFEEVLKIKDLEFDLKVLAILNLCELLLFELKTSEDTGLLTRLRDLSEDLHKKAILENAHSIIAQTLWIQSQIELIDLNVSKARILMNTAQSIAEDKEFDKLALKISNAHDSLLNQLDLWESMTTELTTIAEKLELTHIETILEEMIKGKGVILETPVKTEEKPILLFISSKTDSILYSEQFETKLEKKIIDQILPKIMTKSKERLISGSTDRAVFEEYNYLCKRIEDISFYYLFIGKSYEGIKKLDKFSKQILKTKEIWDALVSASLAEQSLDSSQRILINRHVDSVFQEA